MQDTTMLFGAMVVMLILYYIIVVKPQQDSKKKKSKKEDGESNNIEMEMLEHQFWRLIQDIRQENPRKFAEVRIKFDMKNGAFKIKYFDLTHVIKVTSKLDPFNLEKD